MADKRQKAREAVNAARERSPEKVIADQQQEALALIRARPEYKEAFSQTMAQYKKGPRPTATDIAKSSFREPLVDILRTTESDQRRSLERGTPNLEDLYSQTVGDLIGNRYRDSDTYSGYKVGPGGKREGVGASYTTQSLADNMRAASRGIGLPMDTNTPDVWAREADPASVRKLAQLEAYFESKPAGQGGQRIIVAEVPTLSPETRMDYETPRIKMLQPQKK
jgi:hypothetical protein